MKQIFGIEFQVIAGHAGGVKAANQSAHGGAGDFLWFDLKFVKNLQNFDMGEAASTAAAKGEAYF